MNYSDEQRKDDSGENVTARYSVNVDADSEVMPKIVPVPSAPVPRPPEQPSDERSFAGELLSVIVKSIFVALSLVAMLTCIIAMALPLTSMRVFNNLGMSARAVDFGERYIARALRSYSAEDGRTAGYTNENGDFSVLSVTPELTNDEFIEALYVCNRLSDKLMTSSLKSGDMSRAKYYAERLEKYTRMYLSLNGLSGLSIRTDAENIASVPVVVRPAVYSYEHDMRVSNFRARAVLGSTERMAYNNRRYTDGVTITLSEYANTMFGSNSETTEGRTQLLDDFTDYAAQLGAYLDVEFVKLGVETDLSKRVTVTVGDRELEVTVLNETYVGSEYYGKLDGDEFSLFMTPLKDATETSNGFTRLFSQLSCFSRYAQWAVDTVPNGDDGALHQLHWLKVLSSVSQKLWYMEMLMYYSSQTLGLNSDAIINSYTNHTCQRYTIVKYDGPGAIAGADYQLSEVYSKKLANYIKEYQS